MMNPVKLLEFRKHWGDFEARHPKFVQFVGAIMKSGISEGSIIEVKITFPDGRELESNLKVSPEDVEFIKSIGEINS